MVEMFIDEARLASQINHPNVVHTYEVGEHGGSYFIAMEYLEGQSLHRLASELHQRGVSLSVLMAVRIAMEALAGLHCAHELAGYDGRPLQLVHRDVSPHNVFITYDGQVKLLDFGIAKAASSRTQTEVGILKGKAAYMSPEQACSEPLDRRSDVFSLGIVLWEMLAGRRLFAASSTMATLQQVLRGPILSLGAVAPDVDRELDAIVMRALSRSVTDRFQTAQDMRDALEAWVVEAGASSKQEEIGRLVRETFPEAREAVKTQIQRHMAAATNPGEGSMAEISAIVPGPASPMPRMGGDTTPGEATPSFTVRESATTRPKSQRRVVWALVAIAAGCFVTASLALGIGLLALFGRDRRSPPSDVSTSTAAASAAPALPDAGGPVAPAPSDATSSSTREQLAPSPPPATAPRHPDGPHRSGGVAAPPASSPTASPTGPSASPDAIPSVQPSSRPRVRIIEDQPKVRVVE
jgi:serine/threonine-protein kinase